MRILLAGTSAFAVPVLEALVRSGRQVVGVLTQPDRPAGRGQKVQPSALKAAAERAGIPIVQPAAVNLPESFEAVRRVAPDLILTAAYGQKMGKKLLALPSIGCYNVHGSLLPKYRGASPIQHALLAGETRTGVTIFLMESRMDAGPVLDQAALPILPEETAGELETHLAALGAERVLACLPRLEAAASPAERATLLTPQDESQVTYAPLLTKEDGRLDWSAGPAAVRNRIRGLTPWPGTFTFLRHAGGEKLLRVVVLKAAACERRGSPDPGAVLAVDKSGIAVSAGPAGSVLLLSVKPESRAQMSAVEFAQGYRVSAGDRFEGGPK